MDAEVTTILAHIEIKPGKEEKFEAIMKDMVERTFSEENDVLRYEYFKGQKENFYYCLLSFKDKWAFYHHQNSDHHEGHDFADVLKSYLGKLITVVNPESYEDAPLGHDIRKGWYPAKPVGFGNDYMIVVTEYKHAGKKATKEPVKQPWGAPAI